MIEPKTELIQVWLVEDNEAFCRDVQRVVNGLDGKTCDIKLGSAGASSGASKNNTAPHVVLLNVQLPGVDGIAALSEFLESKVGDSIRQVMGGGASMTSEPPRKVSNGFADPGPLLEKKSDYGLTAREEEILRLLSEGLIKKEIASALRISVNTVSTHLRRVYDKLHVNTNTGAVAKALREEIV